MVRLRILPLVLALLLAACAGTAPNLTESSAEELYRQAEQAAKKEDYERAQKLLDRIRDDFPFSKFAVEAELLGADVAFSREKWEEAAAAYRSFEDQHPTHPKALYALYRRGLAQMALGRPPDRDQTATRNAADAFQKLLYASPDGEFSADARKRLAELRATLAAHELAVAQFYLKKAQRDAALERLRAVVRDYPDTPQREEAASLLKQLEAGGN
jgi:outer membrane protein assembly factor BamD